MFVEFSALFQNGTWDLVSLDSPQNVLAANMFLESNQSRMIPLTNSRPDYL
ncbi:hypothetical protein ACS0TY_013930 [Phlomoides rotata]